YSGIKIGLNIAVLVKYIDQITIYGKIGAANNCLMGGLILIYTGFLLFDVYREVRELSSIKPMLNIQEIEHSDDSSEDAQSPPLTIQSLYKVFDRWQGEGGCGYLSWNWITELIPIVMFSIDLHFNSHISLFSHTMWVIYLL